MRRMRAFRGVMVATVVGATLAIPTRAVADGGAYIAFDKTYFVPGDTAVGEAYVYLLKKQQGILDLGPFYGYLLPQGVSIRKGHPIPAGAMRLGSFSIEPSRPKWFELRISFSVPEVPGAFYSVGVCNDPCTIPGFREPLTGVISVVHSLREGRLLTKQQRLRARIYTLHRDVRTAEKRGGLLQVQVDANDRVRSELASEVGRLKGQLAASNAKDRSNRLLIDPWSTLAVAVAFLILAWVVAIRRRRLPRVAALDVIEQPTHDVEELADR